jgi:hypothetical protein
MANERLTYTTVAQAVGEVSIWWSGIEGLVHGLALRTAQLNEPALRTAAAQKQLNLILANLGQRDLFAALKALALDGSPDDLFPRLDPILNELDNRIRPERNRYMHDSWEAAEGGVHRRTRSTRIINNQGVRELRLAEHTPYSTFDDIDSLTRRIKAEYGKLEAIFDEIVDRLGGISPAGELT